MMRRELLIGCGNRRIKHFSVPGATEWSGLETLDHDIRCNPDHLVDLEEFPLPFAEDSFDEIHAYEVLEHTGKQGDYSFFFAQFSDFWRILKPNGHLIGSVPSHGEEWVWGDPSHSRMLSGATFTFLSQEQYTKQIGVTAMTDFREIYRADFELVDLQHVGGHTFFALRAVKPSRYVDPSAVVESHHG